MIAKSVLRFSRHQAEASIHAWLKGCSPCVELSAWDFLLDNFCSPPLPGEARTLGNIPPAIPGHGGSGRDLRSQQRPDAGSAQ